MKKLLVIAFSLLGLTACGSDICERGVVQLPPQVLVQQPQNNFVVVQRGFYAGCRGNITNVYYSYPYGRVFNINPLVCNGRVFYNVQIAEGFIQ